MVSRIVTAARVTIQGQPEMIHSAIVGDDGNRPATDMYCQDIE